MPGIDDAERTGRRAVLRGGVLGRVGAGDVAVRGENMTTSDCDGLSDRAEEQAFECSWCNALETDATHWPYCSDACAVAGECDDLQKAG